MWVGLGQTRVTELWMPPRVPEISLPGVFRIRSWTWYMSTMPGLTRWLTTARAATAPLALYNSTQSLSSTPMLLASVAEIHTMGPPRDSTCMMRLSLWVEWMAHFWWRL